MRFDIVVSTLPVLVALQVLLARDRVLVRPQRGGSVPDGERARVHVAILAGERPLVRPWLPALVLRKAPVSLNFSYACPEPVLAKMIVFEYIMVQKGAFSAPRR